jgi:porphobilinogen deaminase
LDAGQLHLTAAVLSDDGTERLCAEVEGHAAAAEELGNRAGELLLAQGAAKLVRARR